MIPASFDYLRAGTVDEAVRALADAGDEAKVIAGGQSLLPLLRLRLAYPELLVDVGSIDTLRGVRDEGDTLLIGAMTTHHDVLADPLVAAHCPLLALATATVADPAVRHRGTLGGSLAHSDPAGDLPAVTVALGAELVAQGPGGSRAIPAESFFVDYLTSALSPDEVLTGVRVPKVTGARCHYEKFHRTAQAWAIVGVAACLRIAEGRITEPRIALTNMGQRPVRARAVESALEGVEPTREAIDAAASRANAGTDPPSDLNGGADYRRHLAVVLTGRAVAAAADA